MVVEEKSLAGGKTDGVKSGSRKTKISARNQIIKVTIPGFCFNEKGDIMGRPVIWNPDRTVEVPFPKGMRLDKLPSDNVICWGRVKANWDEIEMEEIEDCSHCLGEGGTLQLAEHTGGEDPGTWICEVCGEEIFNPSLCFPEE